VTHLRFHQRLCVAAALAGFAGCSQGTTIPLADAPPYTPPPAKKIEDMTKQERQRLGGTAGLKFDSSGNAIKQ
jgi:hypothetical protein